MPRCGHYGCAVGYNESNLHRDEAIVLDLHPHWIMLVKSVLALVFTTAIGLALLVWMDPDGVLSAILRVAVVVGIVSSLTWVGITWIKWFSTEFVVTTDRCIYRSGVFAKSGVEIPLDRINTIFFSQGILDRIVGAGTLVIESAGEMGRQMFEDVRDPVHVQNVLYQEMEDNENRKFDRIGGGDALLSTADEIAKLVELRQQGHISTDEFESEKAKLLNSAD